MTGLDLVGLQLAVAAGRPLPFGQADVAVAGHAVEVRLCAERPREDYRPTPGTASHVRWPEGAGLRVDGAIGSGSTISAAYDSLVAKVMAHGADRDAAIARLSRAVRALELDGIETNRELLGAVLDDAAFRGGELDVHYLENRPDLRDAMFPGDARRGAVTKVLVAVGDAVAEGDGLVVLEAMKMEHTLRANGAGTVAAIHCSPGQQVDVNDLLVAVEPP